MGCHAGRGRSDVSAHPCDHDDGGSSQHAAPHPLVLPAVLSVQVCSKLPFSGTSAYPAPLLRPALVTGVPIDPWIFIVRSFLGAILYVSFFVVGLPDSNALRLRGCSISMARSGFRAGATGQTQPSRSSEKLGADRQRSLWPNKSTKSARTRPSYSSSSLRLKVG